MKIRSLVLAICTLTIFVTLGCGGKQDFNAPKLKPCSIKLTKAGAPLAGAMVILYGDSGDQSFSIGGDSDASGMVAIRTIRSTFQGDGAPEGTYKVTIEKGPVLEGGKTSEELEDMDPAARSAYSKEREAKLAAMTPDVPKVLNRVESTPLTFTVSAAGGETLTVEVDDYK